MQHIVHHGAYALVHNSNHSHSATYPNEIEEYSNPDKFASFALIMAKQAFIADEFNSLNANYSYLSTEVKNLSSLVRSLQGLEGGDSDSDSTVSEETIARINNTLSTLNESVTSARRSLNELEYDINNNYLKTSDLGSELEPFGYLTSSALSAECVTQSQLETASYLTALDLSSCGYVTSTDLNSYATVTSVSNISNAIFGNGTQPTTNNFKTAVGNAIDNNTNSLLLKILGQTYLHPLTLKILKIIVIHFQT